MIVKEPKNKLNVNDRIEIVKWQSLICACYVGVKLPGLSWRLVPHKKSLHPLIIIITLHFFFTVPFLSTSRYRTYHHYHRKVKIPNSSACSIRPRQPLKIPVPLTCVLLATDCEDRRFKVLVVMSGTPAARLARTRVGTCFKTTNIIATVDYTQRDPRSRNFLRALYPSSPIAERPNLTPRTS